MPSTHQGLLGIGTNLGSAELSKKFQDLSITLTDLNKKLFKWVVPEQGGGGGLFYKQSAINFANFARNELLTGASALQPLSLATIAIKRRLGYPYPEAVGVATGEMANAIRPIRAGSGWKVGIPQRQRLQNWTDSFKTVYQVAYMLEHGRKAGVSAKTNREITYQPPRPWFQLAFKKWAEQEAPALMKTPFGREFQRGLMKKVNSASPPKLAWVNIRKNVRSGMFSGTMNDVKSFSTPKPGTKAGTYTFTNEAGKLVSLIYDSQGKWFDKETKSWVNMYKAQQNLGLPKF